VIMPGNAKKRVLFDISKRKALRAALFMVAIALKSLSLPLSLNADTSIVITDVDASSNSSATLTINMTSITFPNANPGAVPMVPANENPVAVTANVQIEEGSTATLTVLAGGDLVSGSDTIPINRVSWTATGGGLLPGIMSKVPPGMSAGSWTSPGEYTGAFSFFMANSWSYATGNYSQTLTYTVTAP